MKKRVIILSMIAALFLSACGGSKVPDGMSDQAYEIGLNALEVIEQYNAGDLTEDEALDQVDTYYNRLEELYEHNDEEYPEDLYLRIYVDSFRSAIITGYGNSYEAEDDLKEILEVK